MTDEAKIEAIQPALTPKLKNSVMGGMDIVGYLYVKEDADKPNVTTRQLLVQPVGKWDAKDRSGVLGTVIESPTLPNIMSTIIKGGK